MYISLLGSFEINLMNQQEWPISTNNNLILIQGSYDRMMLQRSHKLQTLCISFFGFPKCFKFLEALLLRTFHQKSKTSHAKLRFFNETRTYTTYM